MKRNEITIDGVVYVPKDETTTKQAQPEPTEGQTEGELILCIEARDLGEQAEITAAVNGKGTEVLEAWASASARILGDMGVSPVIAFALLAAEMKNGKQEEESDD